MLLKVPHFGAIRFLAMNEQPEYMNFPDLANRINELVQKLHDGTIGNEELDELTSSTLALYDRLVVVRYNVIRKAVSAEKSGDVGTEDQPNSEKEYSVKPIAETEQADVKEPDQSDDEVSDYEANEEINSLQEEIEHEVEMPGGSSFQLNFAPVSPNQISLIDSIEEISKEEKTRNESFEQETPTLASKLQKKPISDLKTAIGINQRFLFTSELFHNDSDEFNKAIDRLNSFSSFLEADEFIENQLRQSYDWDMKNKTVMTFIDLVHRRYL